MNNAVKIKNGFFSVIFSVISLCFALSLIIFSDAAKEGADDGLIICRDVILTSVFPFSVAATLLIGSGSLSYIGRLTGKVLCGIFNVSSEGAGVILLGAAGGFPTGAYAAADLYKTGLITKKEAEKITSYTNNPTPAFMICYVGSLLGSACAGVYCYLCVLFSALLWGLIIRGKYAGQKTYLQAKREKISFTKAVSKSAGSTVVICAFIIVFSVISNVISGFVGNGSVSALIRSFFEITSGTSAVAGLELPKRTAVSLLCGVCAFSGICIFSQVKTEADEAGLSVRYYVAGKAVQAVLSFFISYVLYPFIFRFIS